MSSLEAMEDLVGTVRDTGSHSSVGNTSTQLQDSSPKEEQNRKYNEAEMKRALRKIYNDVRCHTKVKEVLPKAFSKDVITPEEKQNIQQTLKNEGDIAACEEMIDTVMTKGHKHILAFTAQLPDLLKKKFEEELKNPTGETAVQRALFKIQETVIGHTKVKEVLGKLYSNKTVTEEEKQNVEARLVGRGEITACRLLVEIIYWKEDRGIEDFIQLLTDELKDKFQTELKNLTNVVGVQVQSASHSDRAQMPQKKKEIIDTSVPYVLLVTKHWAYTKPLDNLALVNRMLARILQRIPFLNVISCCTDSEEFSEESKKDALEYRVTLQHLQGLSGLNVTHIIGYAPGTFKIAVEIQKERYPDASIIFVNYEIPSARPHFHEQDTSEMEKLDEDIVELASKTKAIFSLGHETYEHFNDLLVDLQEKHKLLLPIGLKSSVQQKRKPHDKKSKVQIVTFGPIENEDDFYWKGLDFTTKSISRIIKAKQELEEPIPDWTIRGITEWSKLKQKFEQCPLSPFHKNFTTMRQFEQALATTTVCLLSSQVESFQMIGLDVIAAGVPMLVASNSGLAKLIKEIGDAGVDNLIVETSRNKTGSEQDTLNWKKKLLNVLKHPAKVSQQVKKLYQRLCENRSVHDTHDELWQSCGIDTINLHVQPVGVARGVSSPIPTLLQPADTLEVYQNPKELSDIGNELGERGIEILSHMTGAFASTVEIFKSGDKQKMEEAAQAFMLIQSLQHNDKKLINIKSGSVIFSMHCPTMASLELFWEEYTNGTLKHLMESLLITKKMLRKYHAKAIVLKTTISEAEYSRCRRELLSRKNSDPADSYNRYSRLADECVENEEPKKALMFYSKAIVAYRGTLLHSQSAVEDDNANEVLAELFLKCSKTWFTLQSLEECITHVDIALDLFPTPEAYEHRAKVMNVFGHKREALKNYIDVLMSKDMVEDSNEQMFTSIVYECCCLMYETRAYKAYERLQEVDISATLWQHVIHKLTMDQKWQVMHSLFKHYSFGEADLELRDDYKLLLEKKNEKYVPQLLVYLVRHGVEIRHLFPSDMKSPEVLLQILNLSGSSPSLFELACNKLYIEEEEKHTRVANGDTVLHLLCRKHPVKWNCLLILLNCGVSPWVFNHDFQLPHELIDANHVAFSSLKRLLIDKYASDVKATNVSQPVHNRTHVEILLMLKHSPESHLSLPNAMACMLKFASHNGRSRESKLYQLSCDYMMVWVSILDILDVDVADANFGMMDDPPMCLTEALHRMLERNKWQAVCSLMSQNVFLENVHLHNADLAECIEFLSDKGHSSHSVLSYLKVLTKHQASVAGTNPLKKPLVSAVERGLVQPLLFLLDNGADLSVGNPEERTRPLIHEITDLAIKTGNFQILEKCIEKHGEQIIQDKDAEGNSLLHHVAKKEWSQTVDTAMKLLCDYTVNPLVINSAGETPQRLIGKRGDGRMTYLSTAQARYISLNPRARRRRKQRWVLDVHLPMKVYDRTPSSEAEKVKLEKQGDSLIGFVSTTERMKFVSNLMDRIASMIQFVHNYEPQSASVESNMHNYDVHEKLQALKQSKFENLPFELQMASNFVQSIKQLMRKDKKCMSDLISLLELIGKKPRNVKNKVKQSKDVFSSEIVPSKHLLWMIAVEFSDKYTDKDIRYAEQVRCLTVAEENKLSETVPKIQKSISLGKKYKFLKFLQPVLVSSLQKSSDEPVIYKLSKGKENGVTTTPVLTFEDNSVTVQKDYPLLTEYMQGLLLETSSDLDVPFTASAKEHEIIHRKSPTATLLLGRSGTGKTTCCFRKLWESFIAYWKESALGGFTRCKPRERKYLQRDLEEYADVLPQADTSYDHLKQLFVTKNAILVSEVETVFRNYCHTFRHLTQKRNECEKEELPLRLQKISAERYPLMLTSRRFLMLLDASLPGEGFFYNELGIERYRVIGWTQDAHLEVLVEMMEDIDDGLNDMPINEAAPKEVTPDYFELEVWPKIKEKKSLCSVHPSLIWTEIISFIKGSDEAMKCDKGFLSLERYREIGRKQAVFGEEERDDVYSIFKQYQKFAKEKNLFDITDVVFQLHERLQNTFLNEWMLHELYIDEAQDFTQAEISLYLKLCQDPNKVFLTGDTAQTIMRGVTFRFQELTTLFHSLSKELSPCNDSAPIAIPKVQHLVENYRSHEGILRLASSTVSLMKFYFPQSFDASLPPDVGSMPGPKPVIIESMTPENLAILLRGNSTTGSQIDFGANQAILVVNDRARDEIPLSLQAGIVLTIYEAKGLEFEDVLLYNFFKDSSCTASDWDVIRGDCKEILALIKESAEEVFDGIVDIDIQEQERATEKLKPPPNFDPKKHKILNTDLKYLYTAVTRARRKLWIYDESEEKQKPMFSLFKQSHLAEFVEVLEDIPEQLFASETTTKEWEEQGDFFLERKMYGVAKTCFQKANATGKCNTVEAYMKIEDIQRSEKPPRVKCEEYIKAGKLFFEAMSYEQAAKCFYNGKEFKLAVQLWKKLEQYALAANVCSRKLRDYKEAAECYSKDTNYKEAIEMLIKLKDYSGAAALIKQFSELNEDMQEDISNKEHSPRSDHTLDRIGYQAAVKYYVAGDYGRMNQALEEYLRYESKVAFLLKRHLLEEALVIMEKEGKFKEAAERARMYGYIGKAIEYSEKADGMQIFQMECILIKLRNAVYRQEHIEDDHMKLADNCLKGAKDMPSRAYAAEIMMLCGILRKDINLLNQARRAYIIDCKAYAVGAIHCTEMLMEMSENHVTTRAICSVLSQTVSLIMETASALTTKTSNIEEQVVQNSKVFFGITTGTTNDMCSINIKENPRLLAMLERVKNKADVQKDENGHLIVQAVLVEEEIANSLMLLAESWCQKAEQFLKEQLKKLIKCEAYAAGFECKREDCVHKNYDKESHKELIYTVCLLISLERSVNKGLSLPICTKYRGRIQSMLADKMFTACAVLWNILFSTPYHEWASTSSISLAFRMLKQLRQDDVLLHINDYVTDLWNKSSQQQRQSDIALLIKVWWLFQMMNRNPNKVRGYLRSVEKEYQKKVAYQKYKERIPRHVGMLYVRDGTYRSVMNILMDSTKMLYIKCNPVEAVKTFTRFIALVVRRDRKALFPPKGILMPYIEFMTVVTMAFILKFQVDKRKVQLLLPTSYLALVRFFDFVFLDDKWRARCYDSVKFYTRWCLGYKSIPAWLNEHVHYGILPGLKETFSELLMALLGEFNSNYDILDFSTDDLKSGTEERMVVFLLVVLLNRDKCGFPIQLEELIRRKLLTLHPNTNMSERFRLLLEHVQGNDQGFRGISKILRSFLHQRNNEYLQYCHWNQSWDFWNNPVSTSDTFEQMPPYFYSYMELPQPQRRGARPVLQRQESATGQRETLEAGGITEHYDVEDMAEESDLETQEDGINISKESNLELKKKAIKIIVRFLRFACFKKRLSRLKFNKPTNEAKRLEAEYNVDDTMCKICGLLFVDGTVEETDNILEEPEEQILGETEFSQEMDIRQAAEYTENESKQTRSAQLRKEHVRSAEHKDKEVSFLTFCKYYENKVVQRLVDCGEVISKLSKENELLEYDLLQSQNAKRAVEVEIERLKKTLKWHELTTLKEKMKQLSSTLTAVKDRIELSPTDDTLAPDDHELMPSVLQV